jgi:hypothetical protein
MSSIPDSLAHFRFTFPGDIPASVGLVVRDEDSFAGEPLVIEATFYDTLTDVTTWVCRYLEQADQDAVRDHCADVLLAAI